MPDFIFSSISLRYTKKKKDESIGPCGTENSDDFPSKTTLWDLPDRYDSIHFKSECYDGLGSRSDDTPLPGSANSPTTHWTEILDKCLLTAAHMLA